MNCKALLIAVALLTAFSAGCAKKTADEHAGHTGASLPHYQDGVYTAQSSPDERGAVGQITVTVQAGKITQAEYQGIQKDGRIKGDDYGKTSGKVENKDFYDKAQKAVKGAQTYAPKLVEAQAPEKVDSVTGATVSYRQFVEAAKKALGQAKQ